jgi:hypothetical protein
MSCRMGMQIQMVAREEVDESFLTQVRTWANEVLEIEEIPSSPPYLSVSIWKTMEKYQDFYQKEKRELGVVTGEETDFLATHDAWRGYPRIHICQERLMGIDGIIVQAVIHHETAHALHHGAPEFYAFRFSNKLQEAGRFYGLDLPLLQQCVYLLSVAIKDQDVALWLAKNGLGSSQLALLGYLLSDTEEEHQVWEKIRESHALRKIAFAAFLKALLPIEAMISAGFEGAQVFKDQWDEVYGWLSDAERKGLSLLARSIMNLEVKTFQERLEQAAFQLITKTRL